MVIHEAEEPPSAANIILTACKTMAGYGDELARHKVSVRTNHKDEYEGANAARQGGAAALARRQRTSIKVPVQGRGGVSGGCEHAANEPRGVCPSRRVCHGAKRKTTSRRHGGGRKRTRVGEVVLNVYGGACWYMERDSRQVIKAVQLGARRFMKYA